MADSDVQILATGEQDAPLDYVIKDTVVLNLKAVSALFTDNGAGGDWLPSVVILSDSGHVIARASDQGVKVTAGSDAEVSWFPGVKHAAAAATTGTPVYARGFTDALSGDPAINVNGNSQLATPFKHTFTTDATVISFTTTVNPNDTMVCTPLGTYLFWGSSAWQPFVNPPASLVYLLNEDQFPHMSWDNFDAPPVFSPAGNPSREDFAVMHQTGGGQHAQLLLENTDAFANFVNQAYLSCLYIPTA